MDVSNGFRVPEPMNIVERSSTITGAFVNSIIPVVQPALEEVHEALAILNMNAADVRCAYCGEPATDWDHLRPLVKNRRPTGYITEIGNLVPSCGKCNQSKGGQPWSTWICGNAKYSPKTRKVQDLEKRIERLRAYESWRPGEPIDFEKVLGPELWKDYWESWKQVLALCEASHQIALRIRSTVAEAANKVLQQTGHARHPASRHDVKPA